MEVAQIFFGIIFSITGLLILAYYLQQQEVPALMTKFTDLLHNSNEPDFKNNMTSYGILYILLIFITTFLYYVIKDPNLLYNSGTVVIYIGMILIPMVYFYLKLGDAVNAFDSASMKIAFSAIGILIGTFFLFNYIDLSIYKLDVTKRILYAMFIFGLIVGLAIAFLFFSDYLKKMDGNLGFFVYLIFYIPCMLVDFIKYMIRDFNNSPLVIYILYIVELCIILGAIYLPQFLEDNLSLKGTQLIEKPFFLEKRRTVYSGYDLAATEGEEKIPKHNYSISMWVYINAPPDANENYTIFNYGNKPKLMVKNKEYKDTDVIKYTQDEGVLPSVLDPNERDSHVFVVEYTNNNLVNDSGEIDRLEINLPLQKWNHFVFNYTGNSVDVYANGELKKAILLKEKSPKYNIYDNITIGDDDDANGAICNVKYFDEPLTKIQISYIYNLYHTFNPPMM